MATMLLAGSFRRVKKKEKNYDKCNGETGYFRDAQAEARVHRHVILSSIRGGLPVRHDHPDVLRALSQLLQAVPSWRHHVRRFRQLHSCIKDEALWSGFRRVLIYAAIQIPLNLILSLVAALILDSQRIRHIAVPRILLFLPYAVPGVIAALMWGYIYGDKYGLVGQIASMIGATAPNMLSEKLMLFAIANICTWCSLGYNMLIYYSALIGIPNELYESARIDGASELRIAWSVKIPQIKGSIMMTVLFSVIGTLQLFNEPSILMNSAPNVITSNYTPNLYAYNLAFNGQNLNYAAAVSLVIGVIVMGLVAVVKVIGNKWENK